ncbi:hypothetical protein FIE12Z_455 [Fusarium flagelliforme]|uniref:Uncharacterized protein n=1 Tax=Fusarium flagelliforme TaxID=2675880 RepID=A0A395N4Z6_9HYPO|nr:hypothetical protein FIE12Z_455 [Fusarium flagelliforme]
MADNNNTDGGQMNSRQQQAENVDSSAGSAMGGAGNDGRSLVHPLPDLSPVGTQMFGTSIGLNDPEAWNAVFEALLAISPLASPFVINSKHGYGTDENGRSTINSMHWFTNDEHDGPPVNTITFPDGTTKFLSGANNGQEAEGAETETEN